MTARILIVDDDELVRVNLELVLSLEGYQVVTADSGLAALRLVETRGVDLVVLDITMSGMNGWDTLRRLRARRETASLPIIALTADRRESAAFRRAGFNAHVPKGGSLDRFLVTVRAALDERLGPQRLWLQSCEAGRILTVPLADAGGPPEPFNEYVAGLPPVAHHAVIDGRQYAFPRI